MSNDRTHLDRWNSAVKDSAEIPRLIQLLKDITPFFHEWMYPSNERDDTSRNAKEVDVEWFGVFQQQIQKYGYHMDKWDDDRAFTWMTISCDTLSNSLRM